MNCEKCGKPCQLRPNMFHWRGQSFTGWYCPDCNALWENKDDSMFAHITKVDEKEQTMKKVTPEEMFAMYRDITYQQQQEGRGMEGIYIPPATWEEVDEQRKAIFKRMARNMNCVSAEFSKE